jgi:hypothetical protein
VLSDVYYPTNDNTNVETLQYVVTDGSTFTDIQTRDTTYTVQLLDAQALDCRVTVTAKSGKYRIITDYLTDPANNTVVMHAKFQPLVGDLSSYQLYVIYNPSDITEFRVILSPDKSTVTFKLQTRDLSPTFGSPLGAQLVDVYVHDPNALPADTSTAASFPQRNYVIASDAAWSRLLEVQGFG